MISVNELKKKIRKLNNEENIPYEVLYQNFFFERFLERLSVSKYKSNFVIKGGYLISTLVGFSGRTTSDVDITLTNQTLSEEKLTNILNDILSIDLKDDVSTQVLKWYQKVRLLIYNVCWKEFEMNLEEFKEALFKEGKLKGYLFQCIHCGQYRLCVDLS